MAHGKQDFHDVDTVHIASGLPPMPNTGDQKSGDQKSGDQKSTAQFVRLLTKHERHLRAFLFNMVVDCEVVDEIMQEVSTVLWRKYEELGDDNDFLRWAYVIARYEVLMYRRRMARDRLVFDEALIERLADDYQEMESAAVLDRRQKKLAVCLQRLDDSDRALLVSAYSHGVRINGLAEKLNRSANSLYKSLGRLRRRLRICIQSELPA